MITGNSFEYILSQHSLPMAIRAPGEAGPDAKILAGGRDLIPADEGCGWPRRSTSIEPEVGSPSSRTFESRMDI